MAGTADHCSPHSPSPMAHGLPLQSSHAPLVGEAYVLGIDEAGRGPILGPMVYGASWCALKDYAAFAKLGFMGTPCRSCFLALSHELDSKQLKLARREELFKDIRECRKVQVNFKVTVISAEEISNKMQSRAKINLNLISHSAAIDLIRHALDCGFNVKEVYVDTVGKPAPYQRKLEFLFPDMNITVSEKADAKFPVVSAASICAKVIRDNEMLHYRYAEKNLNDLKYGSGYLADPATEKWIVRNVDKIFGFPTLVRFSWKPTRQAMDKGAVAIKWCRYGEDDDDEVETLNQSRLSFRTRYRFFTENDLDYVDDF